MTAPIQPRREVTDLTPEEYQQFLAWVATSDIKDYGDPRSFYDYAGYWKDVASKGVDQRKAYTDGLHFPDTYKQHGHPTFSVESKYSAGPNDGGRWDGETYIPQAPSFDRALTEFGSAAAQIIKQRPDALRVAPKPKVEP